MKTYIIVFAGAAVAGWFMNTSITTSWPGFSTLLTKLQQSSS